MSEKCHRHDRAGRAALFTDSAPKFHRLGQQSKALDINTNITLPFFKLRSEVIFPSKANNKSSQMRTAHKTSVYRQNLSPEEPSMVNPPHQLEGWKTFQSQEGLPTQPSHGCWASPTDTPELRVTTQDCASEPPVATGTLGK